MAEETENLASLMARRDYARALPILERDVAKYPSNVRLRLQLADALAGVGRTEEAVTRYDETAHFYEDNGLIVQAIAVKKKSEKLRERLASAEPPPPEPPVEAPQPAAPASPLFEDMTPEEREALVHEMVLQQYNEGDIVITEGEEGSSLYVIVSGEVKVYSRGPRGDNVFLAKLTDGDFFGEVSVLTGKPRTATITASRPSELLRLDKDKLDRAVERFPRIRAILDDFYRRRANHTVEAMIDTLRHKREG